MYDIGIDLGTATVQIFVVGKGIVLSEPSVVAMNIKKNAVVAVGNEAYSMLGRTPDNIRAVRPLADGVISDFEMTNRMINYFIKKVCKKRLRRPRIAICVPSEITEIERSAVRDAAYAAGAGRVFLIDEPVAAALGAGVDISKPNGNMILDIGGGTADIAVLTLNGIAISKSIKVAGNAFDESIKKYVRNNYRIIIGDKTAEKAKKALPEASENDSNITIKGRNLSSGLPEQFDIYWKDIFSAIHEDLDYVVNSIIEILEKTPPELVNDIHNNGIYMTGGGALVFGLGDLITERTGIRTIYPEDSINCVARGTGFSFKHINAIRDGFCEETPYKR